MSELLMWNPETHTLKDPYTLPILHASSNTARDLAEHPTSAKIPVAYPTKANKDNWRKAFVGAADLDTYQQFWKARMTANLRLGLFNIWNATWVGDSE
jgi:hypothetical protein